MLPVVDKPAIQYVVEEAVRAGFHDVLMITGRNKRPLEDHFDRMPFLEETLEAKGDVEKLEAVRKASSLADIHFVRQGDPKGLGHAVLRAQRHIGNEPFAVLLGDDLIHEHDEILQAMVKVQKETGGSVVALLEVDPSEVSAYGCADILPAPHANYVTINGLVEKPDPADAPSNLAIIGRYVLHPRVFDVLEETPAGRGGEIQLTDALQILATAEGEGSGVYGVIFRGRRFDTGDKLSYLKAVFTMAIEREDLGPALTQWLDSLRYASSRSI
jgi:UTP--glucose-1-phosphate uridylyltransferase